MIIQKYSTLNKVYIHRCTMLLVALFLSGCGMHSGGYSYFNNLAEQKQTVQNRQLVEKFWSTVRPVSTLSASHYKLGLLYQQQGKYGMAVEQFTKALAGDGRYCQAYNGIGMSYDALGQCEQAYVAYQQGLQCAPDAVYLYNNYGCSSLLCGDPQKAEQLFARAAKLQPDNARVANNFAFARSAREREIALGQGTSVGNGNAAEPEVPSGPVVGVEGERTGASTGKSRAGYMANTALVVLDDSPLAGADAPNGSTGSVAVGVPVVIANASDIAIGDPRTIVAAVILPDKKKVSKGDGHPRIDDVVDGSGVELSNGNGVEGMAGRSAEYLRRYGFRISRITNAGHYRYSESVIYYRDTHFRLAQELEKAIPGVQIMKKVATLDRVSIGVKVLLGRDLLEQDGFRQSLAQQEHKVKEPDMNFESLDLITDASVKYL